MRTIRIPGLWTIKVVAEALGVQPQELIDKFLKIGAPKTLTVNSTLDDDLANIIALKYCCYLERTDHERNDGQQSN
jgi:hypothetical protein